MTSLDKKQFLGPTFLVTSFLFNLKNISEGLEFEGSTWTVIQKACNYVLLFTGHFLMNVPMLASGYIKNASHLHLEILP